MSFKIFLDIDGVLNNMILESLSFYLGWNVREYPLPGNYDIIAACSKAAGRPVKPSEFWEALTRKFWANISLSPMAPYILDRSVELVGRENVFLLSSPVIGADALAGKLEWVQRYLPTWIRRQYIFTPHKHLCAKEGTLLIDDCEKNTTAFREAGGQAFLVPAEWNSKYRLCKEFSESPYFYF